MEGVEIPPTVEEVEKSLGDEKATLIISRSSAPVVIDAHLSKSIPVIIEARTSILLERSLSDLIDESTMGV